MRHADPRAAIDLAAVSASWPAARHRAGRQFWRWRGLLRGQAAGWCRRIYVKRVASRVLLQYASLARGEAALSERLAQDLLFFCAQARPHEAAPPPLWPPCAAPAGVCRGTSRWTTSRRRSAVRPGGAGAGAQARRRGQGKLVRPGRRRPGAPEASVDQLGLVVESLQRLHPGSRRWRRR
jgi:chemosensory pili system protein ChpA (sensor histidine kinase/response regulator)